MNGTVGNKHFQCFLKNVYYKLTPKSWYWFKPLTVSLKGVVSPFPVNTVIPDPYTFVKAFNFGGKCYLVVD